MPTPIPNVPFLSEQETVFSCAGAFLRWLSAGWILLFLFVPASARGQFEYTNINGSITILAYTGTADDVVIPEMIEGLPVTTIADWAFYELSRVASVSIPESIVTIGDGAFYSCSRLASAAIPASVTNIGTTPFYGCSKLGAITVDGLNSYYSSVDGVLFDKGLTTLLQAPGGKSGSYTIPNGVTTIAYGAFFACAGLTNITLPNSVTRIGDYAFRDCSRLRAVYFRGNTPALGWFVFYGVTDATVYYLPGAAGWAPTFGGRPAALWNPQVQTGSLSFGVRSNRFGFTVIGTTNIPALIEGSDGCANTTWVTLRMLSLTNGSVYFSDPQWTNYRTRFYRIRSP